jgi:hypothetical protein
VTDTLATKILMGALGFTPAYDRYVAKPIKKYDLHDAKMRCAKPYSFIRKSIGKISEIFQVIVLRRLKYKAARFLLPSRENYGYGPLGSAMEKHSAWTSLNLKALH